MSEICGNTNEPVDSCPCPNCAPETYGPIDEETLKQYEEALWENEWRLVHTCKEIRRLRGALNAKTAADEANRQKQIDDAIPPDTGGG